ncbi:MAG: aminoacyl-tRNA hydrolase [Erysipelotrichaceae bacterium]|nr:aminoacyl-tRNA hydrolase [Erysipelotrichaceae bacterium]
MKLIIGLGNPGSEYEDTRHNVGFQLLDYLSSKKGIEINKRKFNGLYGEIFINGEKVLLLKPLSYMNLSGSVVSKFVSFFKISFDDILVIQDDLDMNFGKIKIVYNSSSGGHNGIKDIERCLGSRKYARLKIGIANDKSIDTKDYVLGKFNEEEQVVLRKDYEKLVNVIEDFCSISLDKLMSKYNNK